METTRKPFSECVNEVIAALEHLSRTREVMTDPKMCVKVARFMAFIYELEDTFSKSTDLTEIDIFGDICGNEETV